MRRKLLNKLDADQHEVVQGKESTVSRMPKKQKTVAGGGEATHWLTR